MRWLIVVCLAVGLLFADTEVEQPDADTLDGNWTPSDGADLYLVIDEGSGSPDGAYIQHPGTSNSACEVKIKDPSGDGTCTAVDVEVYAKKSANGGNTRGLDGDIRINGSLEGSKTFSADLPGDVFTVYNQQWTSLSYDMLTEMNTLNVQLTATGTTGGGGTSRGIYVDYVEITLTWSSGAQTLYHFFWEY